ncbi:hypothetical protein BV22DRAFT_1134344 [Leucogyrophana mollusca]|uniref:Uncharacterized protein n=1 Tax=Leucogyrophana mollusca TaxID=85980 RepID=A0ACB8B235_9AGAM|nr:hypothetical protein BV22DRAFT_1134344 [Leucogyrophana mollusca]
MNDPLFDPQFTAFHYLYVTMRTNTGSTEPPSSRIQAGESDESLLPSLVGDREEGLALGTLVLVEDPRAPTLLFLHARGVAATRGPDNQVIVKLRCACGRLHSHVVVETSKPGPGSVRTLFFLVLLIIVVVMVTHATELAHAVHTAIDAVKLLAKIVKRVALSCLRWVVIA